MYVDVMGLYGKNIKVKGGGEMKAVGKRQRLEEEDLKQTSIRMPPDLLLRVRIQALNENRSMSMIVKELLEEYLRKKAKR